NLEAYYSTPLGLKRNAICIYRCFLLERPCCTILSKNIREKNLSYQSLNFSH
ncbi:hypothetical protein L9F63_019304, partial [Diploptera punctata]